MNAKLKPFAVANYSSSHGQCDHSGMDQWWWSEAWVIGKGSPCVESSNRGPHHLINHLAAEHGS